MTTQQLTKKQIRQAVAYNLMGAKYVNSAPSIAGSTTTLRDDKLRNLEKGSWILGTTGTIDGNVVVVDLFEPTTHTMTVVPAFSASTITSHTYEAFDSKYPPSLFTSAIDQAIYEATGLIFPSEDSLALPLADARRTLFPIPSEFAMVNKLEFRTKVEAVVLHTATAAFDESVDSDFTVTVDTKKFWNASAALKFVIAGTVSAGDLASDVIDSKDLSGMTHIEFPIYATVVTVADDFRIILSSTTNASTETEALAIPALTARTDTFVRIALANPNLDTAIISIALEYNANVKANTIYLGSINAVDENSAQYSILPRRMWGVGRENNNIVFKPSAVRSVGVAPLKLTGGSNPTILSSDSSICDIPEEFVIARATALMLMGGAPGRDNDQDDRRGLAAYWDGRAAQEKRKFPPMVNKREV